MGIAASASLQLDNSLSCYPSLEAWGRKEVIELFITDVILIWRGGRCSIWSTLYPESKVNHIGSLYQIVSVSTLFMKWYLLGSLRNHRWVPIPYINVLVQERCNSIANALELHLSCTNPSMSSYIEDDMGILVRWHTQLDYTNPDTKIHGANVGPTWGHQDPGGPHVGHKNLAIWEMLPPMLTHWFQVMPYGMAEVQHQYM